MLSCSGTQDVSVAALRLLLVLSVPCLLPKKAGWGNAVRFRVMVSPPQAIVRFAHCIHYHDSHLESKLSVAVAVMSGPFRAWLKGI